MGIAIKVENLSKAYQLGDIGTGSLAQDLKRWSYRLRGKEDPFLKIGETNDRTTKGSSNMVWSLKDINFEIEQGDAVGIIGRNGAGKSTLLKILSRVTSPTTGSVKLKGRVASLLEVGTGFHPELSGRENIFLNGAILGMRKAEIKKHFDAIVDFAGVERYIDTPVKRYSSGMYVRLAFAVAAHLESEILIVDEVLAVGDAEFQKKCLGKMNDVRKGEGRTVLFVSHNLSSVKVLCNSGIYLKNGKIESINQNVEYIINDYTNQEIFSNSGNININERIDRGGNGSAKINSLSLIHANENQDIAIGSPLSIRLTYKSKLKGFRGYILISINNKNSECIIFMDSRTIKNFPTNFNKNSEIQIDLSDDFGLPEGKYFINIALFVNEEMADYVQNALVFNVIDGLFYETGKIPVGRTLCLVKQTWKYK